MMVALTADAIWIQDVWQIRRIPHQDLEIEKHRNGAEFDLTLGSKKLRLEFTSVAEGESWCREVQIQQQLASDAPQGDLRLPEGVAFVRQAPEIPFEDLGRVEFTAQTKWAADRGLQLRAGMRGADAVIGVHREKCPELGWGGRRVIGLAVRAEDADARKRLRLKWYAEEVIALVKRMLLLLTIQVGVLFLIGVVFRSGTGLQAPTGETQSEALVSAILWLGVFYALPFALVVLLLVLRWPQLLRSAGLAVLAATTGLGLTALISHLVAVLKSGATLTQGKVWVLVDPVNWALIIAGIVLFARAWRLANNARQILPQEMQAVPLAQTAWARSLFGATCMYAVALLGLVAFERYQQSVYLLQPGIDVRREQPALLALSEGVAHIQRGDLASSEQAFKKSLRLWQELTAARAAPTIYDVNLAQTHYNLAWVYERQGREKEAEKHYAEMVAIGDKLPGDAALDNEFRQCLISARAALTDLRGGNLNRLLKEKDETAARKYEDAQVKDQKGEVEAERLYQEAVDLWEEVLPQSTNEAYRRMAVGTLATAYLQLGNLQFRFAKRTEAEATLKKAIDYGEKSVDQAPHSPLAKHNLDLARNTLDSLREQALQEELNKMWAAKRFGDAIDRYKQSIEQQEELIRAGKDRDNAERRLAYRLQRFAWVLAHCPDPKVVDTGAAIKHAFRATQLQPNVGDYWYVLAAVQYRNRDWKDSLETLEKLKAMEGASDGSGLLLMAMNKHQLLQRVEARETLRKAVAWIEEYKRKAEGNAIVRYQYEMTRPALEALRQEAEKLIETK
ncbi:MAG: tetratricopeptide repeat protein [Gemmataceae bacterium]|nr:tetratricopeptide repeat protein [Gemmataceae bacterium]MCI0739401.1 tetratricopeptide repeat protein [Gemmataceae bacterium]